MTTASQSISPSTWPSVTDVATVADLLHQLGDVPADRVRMTPAPGTATEQDARAYNESADRTALVELIDGTLVEKPMGFEEGRIELLVAHFLMNFVLPRKLGIVTGGSAMIRMRGGNVRLPDVTFIAWTSVPGGQLSKEPIPTLPPDLTVEVLSKSNRPAEMLKKRQDYFTSGGKLYWELDPVARTMSVFTTPGKPDAVLAEGDILGGGEVLPGFSLPLAELFAAIDEDGMTGS